MKSLPTPEYFDKSEPDARPQLLDAAKQLRLLQVLEIDAETPSFELTVHDADAVVRTYIAISYTWGPATPTRQVRINGILLEIRENCLQAIKQTHRHYRTYRLWIDSICINQHAHTEKSAQIRLMGLIYSNAQLVAACIGLPDIDLHTLRDKLGEYSLARHVATRPYFNRLWVVQECILASNVSVICGKTRLASPQFRRLILAGRHPGSSNAKDTATHVLRFIEDWGQTMPSSRSLSLSELVRSYGGRGCHDPRDKIYGLLSMASVALQRSLPVDYGKPLLEVMTDLLGTYQRIGSGPVRQFEFRDAMAVAEQTHDAFVASDTAFHHELEVFWRSNSTCVLRHHRFSASAMTISVPGVWYHIVTRSDIDRGKCAVRLPVPIGSSYKGHKKHLSLLRGCRLPSHIVDACNGAAYSVLGDRTYLHLSSTPHSLNVRVLCVPPTTSCGDIVLWPKLSAESHDILVCRVDASDADVLHVLGAGYIYDDPAKEAAKERPPSAERIAETKATQRMSFAQKRKAAKEVKAAKKARTAQNAAPRIPDADLHAQELALGIFQMDYDSEPDADFDPLSVPFGKSWTAFHGDCKILLHPLDLLTFALSHVTLERVMIMLALLPLRYGTIRIPKAPQRRSVLRVFRGLE